MGEQELSYRGAEELLAKSQCCIQAGRRWGGLLQSQHSMRLLQVLCSCSLACKLPPRRLAGTRGALSECQDGGSSTWPAVEHLGTSGWRAQCLLAFSLETVPAHLKQAVLPLHPVPAPGCTHWGKFQSTTQNLTSNLWQSCCHFPG